MEGIQLGGFCGKILNVNLSSGKIKTVELKEAFYQKWLGGYGLGSRLLYDAIPGKTDPLGSRNVIGLTTGLLVGTPVHFSGNFTAVGKSPLTGTWGDSRGGGFFGSELKYAGFDAVFFYGRANNPVYLWIHDGNAEIRDASTVWGCNVYETEDILKEQHADKRVQVASIGTSGEQLSLISAIMTDKGRAAGRQGLATIMGSKKLKAVAVRGTEKLHIEDLDQLVKVRKLALTASKKNENFSSWCKYGTARLTAPSAFSGDSPVKNWKGSGIDDFSTVSNIDGDNVIKYNTRRYGCLNCPVACGGLQQIDDGPYAMEGHRPEYETLAAFGSMCLNDNVESIIYLNHICNDYGLDTISAGCTIAFAMECYENGLITQKDTGGIALNWGDHEAIVEMTKKLAKREGFGDVLADGVRVAAKKIGKGADQYAMHVGGQELPMHDPRLETSAYNRTCQLMYIVDATPARHTQSPHEGFAYQAAGLCWFGSIITTTGDDVPQVHDLINAVTGWSLTDSDTLRIGHRIATMRHAFNLREGFKPSDFTYPDRVLGKPPLKSGPLAGVTIHPEKLVAEYFERLDWDLKTGKPSQRKLRELGLEFLIKDLY
jgi:aldehyde:ferredoxin oxidoreductase